MPSGFIVRLRPVGPWRLGPSSGARDRVDCVLHSDTLYSALTIAADHLGFLAEWLGATVEAGEPLVRVGSAFPFVGRTLLAPAPKHVWPPPTSSSRVRWKTARFVPLHVAPRLLAYEALKEDRWAVDPVTESVLPVEKFGEVTPPFRVGMRRTAAVDRLSRASGDAGSTACLEFAENAGMWCPVVCSEEWRERVQALFRYIADTGVGGERSSGWGRAAAPEFEPLPSVLAANSLGELPDQHAAGYWMLSLYAPASEDRVDWSRGSYALLRRSGRTHLAGSPKVESAMVEEGSVVMAESVPAGRAHDVAPAGAGHPVYRAGFAVAIPVAVRLPGFDALERPSTTEGAPSVRVSTSAAAVSAQAPDAESDAEHIADELTSAAEVGPEAPDAEPAPSYEEGQPASPAPVGAEATADHVEDEPTSSVAVTEQPPDAEPGPPSDEDQPTSEAALSAEAPEAEPAPPYEPQAEHVEDEPASAAEVSAQALDADAQAVGEHVEGSPADAAAESIGEALLASASEATEPQPFVAETERSPDDIPDNIADGGAVEDAAAKADAEDRRNEPDSEEPR